VREFKSQNITGYNIEILEDIVKDFLGFFATNLYEFLCGSSELFL
jgi:hypothetical protein